jgi:hypothetical protein
MMSSLLSCWCPECREGSSSSCSRVASNPQLALSLVVIKDPPPPIPANQVELVGLIRAEPLMWAAIVGLRQARVGKKISLEGSRITIPEIKAAFLARSGDEDLTAGIRWSGGKDAIIQACLLSLGPNLDPMDVDQVASSSAAAPMAAPPPPSSQHRAAIERRVCASESAGGKPEHCRGFVVKTEPPSVLLCTGCLESASRPFSRPVNAAAAPTPRSSVPAAAARPIGPYEAPILDPARARASRPQVGCNIPLLPVIPAQHGPLGSQHWKYWAGDGDSSDDEEEEPRSEKDEDDAWDNPALR